MSRRTGGGCAEAAAEELKELEELKEGSPEELGGMGRRAFAEELEEAFAEELKKEEAAAALKLR